jgi:hypothetical protein
MFKAGLLIAVAGLACSGSASTAPDAAAVPADTAASPTPDAATVDTAVTGADTAVAPDTSPDAPVAIDVQPDRPPADFSPAPDVIVAMLDVDMDAFFFGPTVVGCESPKPAVLTVRNAGSVASGTLRVGLEGSSPDRFRIDKDGCSGKSLPPAGTCVIEVRFVPRQLGGQPLTADLVVGGAAGESATTSLSGEANVTPFDAFPWAQQAPLSFPATAVGAASATMEAVWTNSTDFPASVGQPVKTGVAVDEFTVATNGCTGQTIAAHQSCRVAVQFKPAMTGPRAATLTFGATGACSYSFGDYLNLSGVGE